MLIKAESFVRGGAEFGWVEVTVIYERDQERFKKKLGCHTMLVKHAVTFYKYTTMNG